MSLKRGVEDDLEKQQLASQCREPLCPSGTNGYALQLAHLVYEIIEPISEFVWTKLVTADPT